MEMVDIVYGKGRTQFVLTGFELSPFYCVQCGRKPVYAKRQDGATSVVFHKHACEFCGKGFELAKSLDGSQSESYLTDVMFVRRYTPVRTAPSEHPVVYVAFDRICHFLTSQIYGLLHELGCFVEEFEDKSRNKTVLRGSVMSTHGCKETTERNWVSHILFARLMGRIHIPAEYSFEVQGGIYDSKNGTDSNA